MSIGVRNNRTFNGDWEPNNGLDIPIDLVDDGVVATGNRRGAVKAFNYTSRCHGTSDEE
jgi:hypothetical protein